MKHESKIFGSKFEALIILSLIGGILIIASTLMNLIKIIQNLGFASIFEKISLSSELKVSIPLYATTASLSILLLMIAVYLVVKEYPRTACLPFMLSAIFGLLSL